MTVKLTGNFLATARCLIYQDGNAITWTFNPNTNQLTAAYTGAGSAGSHNPTATIGLTVVNGTATTWMTSDSAPALSQAIVPTWTGAHTFSSNVTLNGELIDGVGSAGTSTYVLSSTGTGVKWVAAASGGSGTVTSITIASPGGTINVTGTNPVTTAGTVDVDVNSVSYDSFILGLPAAATLTGSEIVSVEQGGTAHQTTVAAIAGANGANITPDTHPSSSNVANDEFEAGSSIDTAGTRFSGATAWTWTNQLAATGVVAQGQLILTGGTVATNSLNIVTQPVAVPGGTWAYTCKCAANINSGCQVGMIIQGSGGYIGVLHTQTGGTPQMKVFTYATTTSAGSVINSQTTSYGVDVNTMLVPSLYFQISSNGTVVTFSVSPTGAPGTFSVLITSTISGFLTAIQNIGLYTNSLTSTPSACIGVFDWFRKTA